MNNKQSCHPIEERAGRPLLIASLVAEAARAIARGVMMPPDTPPLLSGFTVTHLPSFSGCECYGYEACAQQIPVAFVARWCDLSTESPQRSQGFIRGDKVLPSAQQRGYVSELYNNGASHRSVASQWWQHQATTTPAC
ncbi:hypothetical protein AOLI_G00220190 [Acnodon oligacanthus]